jgi:vancomycin permeability regulator SanA
MTTRPVLVIFGAAVQPNGQPSTTLRRRVEAAFAFGASRNALYMPTGGVGKYGPAEASVMADVLRGFGVMDSAIVPEVTGTDTLSSVRAVRRLLRASGLLGATIYAVSSAYHLPRCVALLRLAGIAAMPCPPPKFPAAQSLRKRWFWRLREGLALPYDCALVLGLRLGGRL